MNVYHRITIGSTFSIVLSLCRVSITFSDLGMALEAITRPLSRMNANSWEPLPFPFGNKRGFIPSVLVDTLFSADERPQSRRNLIALPR
ncbi:hypothetical protein CEXT_405501 [Caerostris extrusa]|uniref:Secreted protein n=1 Tax=Caerostris extrusa TaxID=172846 RepID=A0AAV4NVA0_CAEEX|nr:hypothetical protein CEXT_405501 [Caerostris extrusa]